jgi:hypothetical protein
VSPNDILSAGNFLNYFGKTDLGCTGVGKVTVYPVFIRKVYPAHLIFHIMCDDVSQISILYYIILYIT